MKGKSIMKKETLIEIILGTIGGLTFALGMCMCLIPEWNLFTAGVVIAIIGALILLAIIPIHKKANPSKNHKPINWKNVGFVVIGIIGALVMGYGMTRIMTGNPTQIDYIIGIAVGIVGIIVCILNYPIYKYLVDKN